MPIRCRFAWLLAATAVFCVTLSGPARAADLYWSGAGTWNTTDQVWGTSSGGPYDQAIWDNGTNDTAVFQGTAGAVSLGEPITVGGLTFSTNGYSLDGGLGPDNVTFGVAGNLNVTTGTTTTTVGFSGTNGITKTGSGSLALRGDSNFTGGFNIAAGIIDVSGASSANAFGDSGNTVTFTGNATLRNHTSGAFTMVQDIHYSTGVTGTHGVTFGESLNLDGVLSGDGTLRMNGGSANGNLRLRNNANTFTGTLDVAQSGGNAQLLEITSFADSTNPIQIGLNTNDQQVTFVNPTNIVFDSRLVELRSTSTNGEIRISANGAGTVSFNAGITGTTAGTKPLLLGGSNSGNNTVGAISDGAGLIQVTKQNGGKWILAGANTYTGNTFVDLGTLELADDAELSFIIGATGVNNSILGGATLNLDGDFVFDLTGAGTTVGDSWSLVDVSNLNETYGSTFTVRSTLGSFTESAGVWTKTENGQVYEFTESTGILAVVVPEPAAMALAGIGLAGFAAAVRRARRTA